MLSKNSFYVDDNDGAYVISKMTEKTVLFIPVKSEPVSLGDVSSAFLYDTERRATREPDDERQPIRFKLSNQMSSCGLASFYENKKGRMAHMSELEDDTFLVGHNYG